MKWVLYLTELCHFSFVCILVKTPLLTFYYIIIYYIYLSFEFSNIKSSYQVLLPPLFPRISLIKFLPSSSNYIRLHLFNIIITPPLYMKPRLYFRTIPQYHKLCLEILIITYILNSAFAIKIYTSKTLSSFF